MRLTISKLSFGIGIFISITLLMGAAFAAGTNTLNVKCADASGKALTGTKVQLLMLGGSGKAAQEKKSDKDGVVRFEKVDDGVYRIVARPEGMAPGLYEYVILKSGAKESVTVTCAAGDPLKKFYFEDPALAQKGIDALRAVDPLFSAKKWPEAEQQLRASLDFNPSSPDTLYYLGLVLLQQKKWDEAKAVWEKDLSILNALVSIPQGKDAKGAAQPSPYAKLNETVRNMIPMVPVIKLKQEAADELSSKNYKNAIAKYQEAIKIAPNDADCYYNMALALAQDNQYDAASQSLDKAIQISPQEKAFADFKEKLIKFQKSGKAKELADAGDALYKTGDYPGAIKKYEESLSFIEDNQTQAAIWVMIGRARTQSGQNDPAVEAYKRAIQLAPNDPKLKVEDALKSHYITLGQKLLNDKQYDQGFAVFKQGGVSLLTQGKTWATKPETESLAILTFEWLTKNEPKTSEALFELGSVYYFKSDNAKAKEYLNKYIESGAAEHQQNAKDMLGVIAAREKKK